MNSIWATEEYRNAVQGKKITASRTGFPLEIFPYADGVVSPKVWGKTEQDGTPTPSAPIDIVGVSGNIISTNGQTSDSVALPVTLHSLGTSVDSFDFSDGEHVKNNEVVSFDGSETWTESTPGTTLTNLVSNGNFVDATGWTNVGLATFSVANNTAECLANSQADRFYTIVPTIIGHKYAVIATVKTSSSLVYLFMGVSSVFFGGTNIDQTKSLVFTATAASHTLGVADNRISGFNAFYAQYVSCVDLTAAFGAGNEPTQTEYETWISKFNDSWFDSTTPKSWTGYPYAFSTEIADAASDGESMCSHFALGAAAYGAYSVSGTDFIFCSDMELIAFKAWLAAQSATETPVKVAFELAATDTSSLDSGNIDCYKNYTKIYSESVPDASITLTNIEEQYSPEFKVELTGMIGAQEIDIGDTLIKSCSLDDACIAGGTVSIGDFVGKRFEVTFFDFDGDYTSTIWDGAELTLTYSVKRTNGEYYSVTKGTFIVDECNEYEGVVFLASSDFRVKFDREFDGTIADTDTLYSALEDVCDDCSVVLGTASGSLPNATVAMTNGSVLNGLNCAEIISYIAQACGRVAYIGSDDKLYLDWYGAPDPALAYDNSIISSGQKVSNGSITVTGIKWTETDGTIHETGTASYVVSVENNPIKVSDFSALLTEIAASLVGFSYTPSSSTLKIFNPALETMDIISVQNRRGDTVSVPIMKISVSGNSSQAIESVGEGATKNASTPVSVTAAIERAKNKAIIVANNAQSTANGKNSMYTQDSEPSGVVFAVGDIWFDSNAGYKMHHWNGSEWHADQFDTDAFAAESITSANLESSAVTAGKIAAGAVTADSFATGAVNVGARNLALGTEFAEWIAYAYADVSHSDETLTNLVSNGNFVDATGWTASSGTGAVANDTYVHTGDGSRFYPYLGGVLPLSVIGHVYAATVRFRVTTTDCLRLVWQHGNGLSLNQPEQVTSPVQNKWYQKTFVYTATNATTSVEIAHIYTDAATASGKVMEVQYVSCVDLTTAFGAENEPTQAEYEKWIAKQPNGWFDDTAKVHGLGGARTNIVKATANDSQTSQFGIQQATTFRTIKLVEGETYTLSFLVRGNVPAINHVYIMNVGADNQAVEMNSEVTSATAFSRVSKTFVADANSGASTGSHLMISFAGAFTTASWFQIQEVKLEKGNVVTDWCPAATETSAFNVATNMRYRIDSERAGYYDATTDEFIGGLAVVGHKVASISQMLTDKEDPNFYATIGDRLDGSVYWRGIYGYYWGEGLDEEEDRYLPTFALECMEDGPSMRMSHMMLKFQDNRRFYFDIAKDMWIGMQTGEGGEGNYGGIMLTNYEDSPHGFIEVESGSDTFAIGADADGPYVNYRINRGANKRTTIPGMQFGTTSIGSASWTSVSYPMAYPAGGNYKVFVTPVTEASGVVAIKIRNESNTGFEMTVGGSGFSNISVNWMAVYYP